jgi:hypothetical protein
LQTIWPGWSFFFFLRGAEVPPAPFCDGFFQVGSHKIFAQG